MDRAIIMPRQPRLELPGVPMHVTQRGVNRCVTFLDDEDRMHYLRLLLDKSRKLFVNVHAYVLMSNHVHLLVSSETPGAGSRMMRQAGHSYVTAFNRRHQRTGTLREGRFKSCLIDSEQYLLTAYRYIELNPVRAAMVDSPQAYVWSSVHANLGLKYDHLVSAHEVFLSLATDPKQRGEIYLSWLRAGISDAELQDIRNYIQQERALGSPTFQAMGKNPGPPGFYKTPGSSIPAKSKPAKLNRFNYLRPLWPVPFGRKTFLERLKTVIPDAATPILVTDAGFRNPWFRVVAGMGWHWIGRLRHRTLLTRPGTVMDDEAWLPSRALYVLATRTPQDIGWMQMAQTNPLLSRVVLYRKATRGRHRHTCFGKVARSKVSRQAAAREREPWLIVASPELSLSPRQLIKLYARRMQIELSFRDLKSHGYGQAFEVSLTRKGHRIEILLLLSALASFASWAAGLAAEAADMVDRLAPQSAKSIRYFA
jgi:putative transposase